MMMAKVWQIYDDIGYIACTTGHYDLAERMFTAAIESCASLNSMQEQKLKSLIGLADTLLLRGQRADGCRLYTRVINIFARTTASTPQQRYMLAHALEKLGYSRIEEQRHDQALKLLQRSLRILESIYGDAHQSLVPRLLQISRVHSQLRNTDESLCYLNRARGIQTALKSTAS